MAKPGGPKANTTPTQPPPLSPEGLQARIKLAADKNASARQLAVLMRDTTPEVLVALADNPNTSKARLDKLARLGSDEVALAVARRAIWRRTLEWLANHPDPRMVLAVLANSGVTKEVLATLTDHPESEVRQRALNHPKASQLQIKTQVQFEISEPLQALQRPLALPEERSTKAQSGLEEHMRREVIQENLENSTISIPLISQLKGHPDSPDTTTNALPRSTTVSALIPVVIDLNLGYKDGVKQAGQDVIDLLSTLNPDLQTQARLVGQYVFAKLTADQIETLAKLDDEKTEAEKSKDKKSNNSSQKRSPAERKIYRIWPDFEVKAL
jgi:hypothetical protein